MENSQDLSQTNMIYDLECDHRCTCNRRNGEVMVEPLSTLMSPPNLCISAGAKSVFLGACPLRSAGMHPCHEIRNQFRLGI